MRFLDRRDAGRQLADRLEPFANRPDVIVLALPRGGVPVAAEIARALSVDLDVFPVRKLGMPGHQELALGAVAAGGVQVVNADLVAELGVPRSVLEQVAARERLKVERQTGVLRGGLPPLDIRDRAVILVDDGLATGATMEAAIEAVERLGPSALVVAVPVGAPETCDRLRPRVSRLVCLQQPEQFSAVGLWYEDFSETTDDEVTRLLAERRSASPGG